VSKLLYDENSTQIKIDSDCWIHLQDLRFFLYLGANPHEKKIGQNIKIDLSLKINFENTDAKLENTVDYGSVVEHLENKLSTFKDINLLEYLCEQLLNSIGHKFKNIKAAKIVVQKGFVPLKNYTGTVKIEAEKNYGKRHL
jgi:dihydroneopterin aldolase